MTNGNKVIFRTVLAILALTGIVLRQIYGCLNEVSCFENFKYFTVQTNYMVFIWLLLYVLWKNDNEKVSKLEGKVRGAITSFITVTFLVYLLTIEFKEDLEGIQQYASLFNHYIVPLSFVLDWVLFERKRYEWKWMVQWLVYPLLYVIFALFIYGPITGNAIYWFFDAEAEGLTTVVIWVVILHVIFFALGSLYMWMNRSFLTKE